MYKRNIMVQFAILAFILLLCRAVTDPDWAFASPLKDYRAMMEDLLSANQADAETLSFFHRNPSSRHRIIKASKISTDEVLRVIMNEPPDPDVIYDFVDKQIPWYIKAADDEPDKRSSWLGYPCINLLQTTLNAFKATGEIRFLDLFIKHFKKIIDRSDVSLTKQDYFTKRIMQAWSSDYKNGSRASIAASGRIAYAAAQFVELSRKSPLSSKRHLSIADRYLSIAEDTLLAFEDDFTSNPNETCFFQVVGSESKKWNGEPHPFNHIHWFGAAHAVLHDITGEKIHLERVNCISKFWIENSIIDENGALDWPYGATRANQNGEQTWKAGFTVVLPAEAYPRDQFFTDDQARALIRTLETTLMAPNGIRVRVSTRDRRSFSEIAQGRYAHWLKRADQAVFRWMYLYKFCGNVPEITLKVINNHLNYFRQGWYGDLVGLEFYSMFLLPKPMKNLCN